MKTDDDMKTGFAKGMISFCLVSILAYLKPISGDLQSLIALFAINFIVGLLNGLLVRGESFSYKKAWQCINEAVMFLMLICFAYFITERVENQTEGIRIISFFVWSIIYFYVVNIIRNLCGLFHHHPIAYRTLNFIYYIISIEFVKRLPELGDYLKKEKRDNENESK
jgi:phage-related holin